MAFLILVLAVQISSRCGAWPESHLASRSETSLDVDDLVVVLELRLLAEDHEQEFLIRIVLNFCPVGADFL